jgi:hypothetical protein
VKQSGLFDKIHSIEPRQEFQIFKQPLSNRNSILSVLIGQKPFVRKRITDSDMKQIQITSPLL